MRRQTDSTGLGWGHDSASLTSSRDAQAAGSQTTFLKSKGSTDIPLPLTSSYISLLESNIRFLMTSDISLSSLILL